MNHQTRRLSPTGDLLPGTRLIEASAGTGKTWNIANIFVRLLVEVPLPALTVDRILVVTFTEAATAELRDRIRKRLREAADALENALDPASKLPTDPGIRFLVEEGRRRQELEKRIQRAHWALEAFDQSSISTIHSFCQRMLRLNAFESRVSFDQEMLTDLRPLLDEITLDFWMARTHGLWKPLARHLETAGVRGELGELAGIVGETGVPLVPEIRPDEAEPPVGQAEREARVASFRADWTASRKDALEALHRGIAGKCLGKRWTTESIAERARELEDWLALGADPSHPLAGSLAGFQASVLRKETLSGKTPPDHPFFTRCDAFAAEGEALSESFGPWVNWLKRTFILHVRKEIARRKESRRVQSFQDLLAVLRARVEGDEGEPLREAIRARFDVALIDEFQDTDPVQWEIFRNVFGTPGGRLYLIGDPKQAIYAFRHADVFAYLAAKQATPVDDRFTLAENHRSDRAIVDVLNRLFGRLEPGTFAFDEIPYEQISTPSAEPRIRIRRGDTGTTDPVAPFQVTFLKEATGGVPLSKGTVEARIPTLVAREIRDFLASGAEVYDESLRPDPGWRRVQPRDVAVLVRKNEQATRVQRALRELGIPGVIHSTENVLKTAEAEQLALVLAAVAEPSRLARLRPALATRLVGASANDIASFETEPGALDRWLDLFHRLSRTWNEHGLSRMFRELLDRTKAVERLLDAPGGEREMTNFLHLAELAGRAESEADLRPSGVLAWLQRQRSERAQGADAYELRLETDEEAVDILTIHRSKGLEFRVVWCPYLWDSLGSSAGGYFRFHDPDDGFQAKLDIGSPEPDLSRNAAQAAFEGQAENLRLLYVALTRAKHRCSVVAAHMQTIGASPLGWFFWRQAGDDARARLASTAEQVGAMSAAELLAGLRALAKEVPGFDLVEDGQAAGPADDDEEREESEEMPPGPPGEPPATTGASACPPVAARTWGRTGDIDTLWRRLSYSGLLKGDEAPDDGPEAEGKIRESGDEAGGHSQATGARESEATGRAEGSTPILFQSLERSRNTGDCLHDILEHIDFQEDAQAWRPVIEKSLDEYGIDLGLVDSIADDLAQVLSTPLEGPGGRLCLKDVGLRDRRSELSFELPVLDGGPESVAHRLVGRKMLAAPFRDVPGGSLDPAYHRRVENLPFKAFHGYLKGVIDLVFRAGGRWYLLDYKSNHLGPFREDYHFGAMRDSMLEGHYFLQYHLYAVALHRFLSWRDPAYRFEEHFGGVFYLYLRGMPGGSLPLDTGVFRDPLPRERIQALSDLLG